MEKGNPSMGMLQSYSYPFIPLPPYPVFSSTPITPLPQYPAIPLPLYPVTPKDSRCESS